VYFIFKDVYGCVCVCFLKEKSGFIVKKKLIINICIISAFHNIKKKIFCIINI